MQIEVVLPHSFTALQKQTRQLPRCQTLPVRILCAAKLQPSQRIQFVSKDRVGRVYLLFRSGTDGTAFDKSLRLRWWHVKSPRILHRFLVFYPSCYLTRVQHAAPGIQLCCCCTVTYRVWEIYNLLCFKIRKLKEKKLEYFLQKFEWQGIQFPYPSDCFTIFCKLLQMVFKYL